MTTTGAEQAAFSVLAFLAESSVRALALAALAGLAALTFRGRRAALQLCLWTTVLYAALAIPVVDRVLPHVGVPVPGMAEWLWRAAPAPTSPVTTSELVVSRTAGVLATSAGTMAMPASDVTTHAVTLTPVIVVLAIYLLGVAFLLLRAAIGWAITRRLEAETSPIDDPRMLARLAENAAGARLNRVPLLTESPRLLVPVTTSVLHPMIIVPKGWRDWDSAKIDAVLVHELAHVSRRDTLTQRLSLIYRAVFWPSPLGWWLHHRLAVLAERMSDEAALDAGIDRTTYAETLVGFFAEQHRDSGRRAVWHVAMARGAGASAEKRVERVLAWERGRSLRLTKTMVAGIVLAAAPLTVLTASVRPEPIAVTVIDLPAPASAPRLLSPVPLSTIPPRISPAVELSPETSLTPAPDLAADAPKGDLPPGRIMVLFLDFAGMQPSDVRRMSDAARRWVDDTMSDSDIVAVVRPGDSRITLTRFKPALLRALDRLESNDARGNPQPRAATGLQNLKMLCDSLGALSQSKTVFVFGGASGLAAPSPASDRQTVVEACGRANTELYTIHGSAMAAWPQVYKPGNGLTNPRPIKTVDPQYTDDARLAKIQGEVDLDVVVLADGTVGDVLVTKSLDSLHGLDAQAVKAAMQWLFKPAMKDGSPVAMLVSLVIEFKLPQVPAASPPAQGVVPPKAIRRVEPKYTSEAMKARIAGDVDLEIVVQTDGTIGDVRVTRRLDPGLDQEAVAAARQWRFEPATKDGQPVEFVAALNLEFKIHAGQQTTLPAWADANAPDTPGLVAPKATKWGTPKYTSDAMRAKLHGDVELEVMVLGDGSVGEVRVTKSLDAEFGLDREAIAAAKQFTFTPATLNGYIVPAIVKLKLEFRLH